MSGYTLPILPDDFEWREVGCKLVLRVQAMDVATVYPQRSGWIFERVHSRTPDLPSRTNVRSQLVGQCVAARWAKRRATFLRTLTADTDEDPRDRRPPNCRNADAR